MQHLLRCRCGRLQGHVTPTGSETHGVCYCRDCQAYAHALGKADDVLDAMGGTEIVGVRPGNVSFSDGREVLACMSLTESGMLRWYAGCCDTPIGNTPRSYRVSFVGVLHVCLRYAPQSIDDSFGPVRMRANLAHAKGTPDPMRLGTMVRLLPFAWSLLRARWSGAYRSTPFFGESGIPVVTPRVLGKSDLDRAMNAV